MTVVPIPAAAGSSSARAKMRSFAVRTIAATAVLPERAGAALLERGGREPRGELARLGAAHAVGDREQRRLADERVLVLQPPAARVGERARAADPSRLHPEVGLADADHVTGLQQPPVRDARAVDERAVGRAPSSTQSPSGAARSRRGGSRRTRPPSSRIAFSAPRPTRVARSSISRARPEHGAREHEQPRARRRDRGS